MDCIFCKIAQGEIPSKKVYEDEHTLAFLDISPVSKGHTLVIPKEHCKKVYELSKKSASSLIETLQKVTLGVERAMNCDFNVLNNNGKIAGQIVDHVHFHVIPRTGEEKFDFTWPTLDYAEGEDMAIIDKIKDNMS